MVLFAPTISDLDSAWVCGRILKWGNDDANACPHPSSSITTMYRDLRECQQD
jgi:hypothetical protein